MPLFGRLAFRFMLRPEFGNFLPGFLAGVPVFHLKHGSEFVKLHLCLVDFEQVVFSHQAPLGVNLPADLTPLFLEYRFIHHVVLLGNAVQVIWPVIVFAVVYSPQTGKAKFEYKFIVLRSGGFTLRE